MGRLWGSLKSRHEWAEPVSPAGYGAIIGQEEVGRVEGFCFIVGRRSGRFLLYGGAKTTLEGDTPHQHPNYLIRVTRMIADPTHCCPVNTERQYSVLSSRAAGAWANGLAPSTTNRPCVYWLTAKEPLRTPHRPAILAVGAAVNTGRQYSVLTSRQLPCQLPRVHPNP